MINIDTIAPAVRAEVETRLAGIEASEGVRFLLAIESGSRAWGFPSPDSDYDIRFVYVREREWYLGLTPGRDVIEQPIVDEIDLNGWDIRKALNLLLKSNATLGEWMDSPIRYRPDDPVVARIKALADAVLNPRALGHHYRNVGINAAARWLSEDGPVPAKKYFYALRPALVIRHMRLNPGVRPPMNLQQLVAGCDLSADMISQIDSLVQAKSETREKELGARLTDVDSFIRYELDQADALPVQDGPPDAIATATAIFRDLLHAG
ncbi:nucleotidyltransferase domain-containing protein [Pseudonocardia sp. TMWB2A]|uniref:nucleotidyltransferase domain-containing protein n=1 Tax=Pseudonocardia sp. TMWB2A TaxID=687430 RepID=UPI00307F7762